MPRRKENARQPRHTSPRTRLLRQPPKPQRTQTTHRRHRHPKPILMAQPQRKNIPKTTTIRHRRRTHPSNARRTTTHPPTNNHNTQLPTHNRLQQNRILPTLTCPFRSAKGARTSEASARGMPGGGAVHKWRAHPQIMRGVCRGRRGAQRVRIPQIMRGVCPGEAQWHPSPNPTNHPSKLPHGARIKSRLPIHMT